MKYKVAVATSTGEMVDTHFGHAQEFEIYTVDEDTGGYELTEVRKADAACGEVCGGSADKHAPMRAAAENLKDMDYVLAARIGPKAVQELDRFGVTAYDIMLPLDEAIGRINAYRLRKRKFYREHKELL